MRSVLNFSHVSGGDFWRHLATVRKVGLKSDAKVQLFTATVMNVASDGCYLPLLVVELQLWQTLQVNSN